MGLVAEKINQDRLTVADALTSAGAFAVPVTFTFHRSPFRGQQEIRTLNQHVLSVFALPIGIAALVEGVRRAGTRTDLAVCK